MLVVPKSEHKNESPEVDARLRSFNLILDGRTPRAAEVAQAGDVITAGWPAQTAATVQQFAFADESPNGIARAIRAIVRVIVVRGDFCECAPMPSECIDLS